MTEWNWIEKINELHKAGEIFAVLTVTRVSGSVPREVGAKIILKSSGEFFGTIGGGKLESLALLDAKKCLQEMKPGYFSYPLGPKADQCCGGLVETLVEVVGQSSALLVFGAGHVAQAVAQVFEGTEFQVFVIDERPEWLERLPSFCKRVDGAWRSFVEEYQWTGNEFAVVMTHSHDLDAEVLSVLAKKPMKYLGLIGSESKWARFQIRLKKAGLQDEDIARIRCPIGVGDLGKTPKAIAVSFAAEVLKLRNSFDVSTGSHFSSRSVDAHGDNSEAAYQN